MKTGKMNYLSVIFMSFVIVVIYFTSVAHAAGSGYGYISSLEVRPGNSATNVPVLIAYIDSYTPYTNYEGNVLYPSFTGRVAPFERNCGTTTEVRAVAIDIQNMSDPVTKAYQMMLMSAYLLKKPIRALWYDCIQSGAHFGKITQLTFR